MATVVLTDYAWADTEIEREIVERAGHRLVAGTSDPASPAEIEQLITAHDPAAIMTCWAVVSAAAVASPGKLRIVQRIGVGLDNIAVDAATARGAWVANVPDYCVGEVSDHAIALLLDWARGITAFDRNVKAGHWSPANARLRRLSDLTVGVVGYGRIGRSTAAKLAAFGCSVLIHDRSAAESVPLEALLAASDAVVLHVPLTPETHHLIDTERLRQMRSGAYLINVSRGPLVDSAALLAALESGHLSGVGLDVVEGEPSPPRALLERADVTVTPHIAFSSEASLIELRRRATEEVVRVLAGEHPRFPCNQPQGSQ